MSLEAPGRDQAVFQSCVTYCAREIDSYDLRSIGSERDVVFDFRILSIKQLLDHVCDKRPPSTEDEQLTIEMYGGSANAMFGRP